MVVRKTDFHTRNNHRLEFRRSRRARPRFTYAFIYYRIYIYNTLELQRIVFDDVIRRFSRNDVIYRYRARANVRGNVRSVKAIPKRNHSPFVELIPCYHTSLAITDLVGSTTTVRELFSSGPRTRFASRDRQTLRLSIRRNSTRRIIERRQRSQEKRCRYLEAVILRLLITTVFTVTKPWFPRKWCDRVQSYSLVGPVENGQFRRRRY